MEKILYHYECWSRAGKKIRSKKTRVFFATIDASSGKPRNGRFISSLEAVTRSTVSQRDTRTSFGELLRCRPNAASGAIVSCILDDFGRVSRSPRSIQFHEITIKKISWFLCLKFVKKSHFTFLSYYFFSIDSLNILNVIRVMKQLKVFKIKKS